MGTYILLAAWPNKPICKPPTWAEKKTVSARSMLNIVFQKRARDDITATGMYGLNQLP